MRPRYQKKKLMGGRLATHGRIGGVWSAGTTARRPNCGLFKFLLPRSIEEAALKVFPNGKLRRIMAIRGQRLSTSWVRLKPYAVHDLETKDVGGHFNLSQQNVFALPRLQEDCSNTSQAALSPINPNEQVSFWPFLLLPLFPFPPLQ